MPSISLFGKKTLLAGDDLQLPCFLFILFRLFQSIFCLLPLWWFQVDYYLLASERDGKDDSDCLKQSTLLIYLWLTYTIVATLSTFGNLWYEIRIYQASCRGTPTTDTMLRSKQVKSLVEFKVLVWSTLFQIVLVILGIVITVLFLRERGDCPPSGFWFIDQDNDENEEGGFDSSMMQQQQEGSSTSVWMMESISSENQDLPSFSIHHPSVSVAKFWWSFFILLWLSQIVELVFTAFFLLGLFLSDSTSNQIGNTSAHSSLSLRHNYQYAEEMWANRCANLFQCLGLCTCFAFGGRNISSLGNYGDVARALTDFLATPQNLGDDVHDEHSFVVPSDVLMGLVILQKLQRLRILQARHAIVTQISKSASSSSLFAANKKNNSRGNILTSASVDSRDVLETNNHGEGTNNSGPDLLQSSSSTCLYSRHSFYIMQQEGSTTYYESTERRILNPHQDTHDRFVLAEGARFARYQLAIYTLLMYLYQNPFTGLFRVACKSCGSDGNNCCCCPCCRCGRNGRRSRRCQHPLQSCMRRRRRRSSRAHDEEEGENSDTDPICHDGIPTDSFCAADRSRIIGPDWCNAHKSALLLQAGLEDDANDLVYAQLNSSFSETPYCICLDHEWKSVVVAIRGTFSLEDCVTDVAVEPTSLEELGDEYGFDGKDQYCHTGIVNCAKIVHRDLENHGLLDQLLLGHNQQGSTSTPSYPNYTLRLVGHSLGAGIATLLSFMLRPKFPHLRCINYSPPGCSMTWKLATEDCHDWCTAFVLDSDIVPRLSFHSMEHLRDEVLRLIGRVKVNKGKVIAQTLGGGRNNDVAAWRSPLLFSSCRDRSFEEDGDTLKEMIDSILYTQDETEGDDMMDTPYQRQLQRFWTAQAERRAHRGIARTTKLYPPGRIVHFMKTDEHVGCCHGFAKCLTCCTTNVGAQYTPIWVKNDDLNEVVISPTMGTDHFPNRFTSVIEKATKDFGIDISRESPYDMERGAPH